MLEKRSSNETTYAEASVVIRSRAEERTRISDEIYTVVRAVRKLQGRGGAFGVF